MSRYELTLFADYHQFYIQDEDVDGNLSDAWTDEAVERLLAVAPGTVGIGTVRNVDVPVTIAVLEREPALDADKFDQVVECSIVVKSGAVVVAGCTDYFLTQRASRSLPVPIAFALALKVLNPYRPTG